MRSALAWIPPGPWSLSTPPSLQPPEEGRREEVGAGCSVRERPFRADQAPGGTAAPRPQGDPPHPRVRHGHVLLSAWESSFTSSRYEVRTVHCKHSIMRLNILESGGAGTAFRAPPRDPGGHAHSGSVREGDPQAASPEASQRPRRKGARGALPAEEALVGGEGAPGGREVPSSPEPEPVLPGRLRRPGRPHVPAGP